MNRLSRTALAAALVLVLCAPALADFFTKSKVIFRKGADTYVKVTSGNKKVAPFEHPHEFTPGQMKAALASLRYFKPKAFSLNSIEGESFEVFTEEEMDLLAAPLAEAFAQADPTQWVDFSLHQFRGQSFLGNFLLTDGVLFIKDGKLNVALRNIVIKLAPDQQSPNTLDPTQGYRETRRLEPSEGQEAVRKNWVAMNPDLKPYVKAVPETAATTPPPPQKTVKERLQELQALYDEGLITEEEYNQKREEILDDL